MTADVSQPGRDDATEARAAEATPAAHVMAELARATAGARPVGADDLEGSAVVAARLGAVRRTAAARAAGVDVPEADGVGEARGASRSAGEVTAARHGAIAPIVDEDTEVEGPLAPGETVEPADTDAAVGEHDDPTGVSDAGRAPDGSRIDTDANRIDTDANGAVSDAQVVGEGAGADEGHVDVTDAAHVPEERDRANPSSAGHAIDLSDVAGVDSASDAVHRPQQTDARESATPSAGQGTPGSAELVARGAPVGVGGTAGRRPGGRSTSRHLAPAASSTRSSRRRDRPDDTDTPARGGRPPALALVVVALVAALVGGVIGGVVTAAATGAFAPSPTTPGAPLVSSGALDDDSAAIASAVAAAAPSVVSLRVATTDRSEVGSGIVLGAEGRVLTNAHVVTLDGTVDSAVITATTADGRVFPVETVGIDVLADLAVVQLQGAEDLVPATFADSSGLTLGQRVVALGSPLGLVGTATSGIVSTVHRSIDVTSAAVPPSTDANADEQAESPRVHLAVFQTDADINPGNSGGPVVDAAGRVVGVSVAIATTKRDPDSGPAAEGSIGLGFAIPANIAVRIAEDLTRGQLPSHGALGATLRSAERVATLDPWIAGAYLETVVDRGAAQRAGLRVGDVVTAIDGVPVVTAGDLIALVRSHPGGERVEIEYVRDGAEKRAEVTLDSAA